jgi:tRNA pseudouridine55 synthase
MTKSIVMTKMKKPNKNQANQKLPPPLIFNVYKPKGITSFDVIRHFKKNFPQNFGKIGHFGTLDPFAEGVLLLGIAGSSRLADYIHRYMPKTYLATGILGTKTDSGDNTGLPIISNYPRPNHSNLLGLMGMEEEISLDDLSSVLNEKMCASLRGEYWQAPPSLSAAKFQGRPLYEWHREGIEISKPAKMRNVMKLEIVSVNLPVITFRATVSSGTYIRTLFEDMAEKIQWYGTLTDLVREEIGEMSIHSDHSLREERWPKRASSEVGDALYFEKHGLNPDQVLILPKIVLDPPNAIKYRQGGKVGWEFKEAESPCWVYDAETNELLGLGENQLGLLKPIVNFRGFSEPNRD